MRACCPQQAIDAYTPDAWHDLLGDLDVMDCRRAVAAIVKRQPFVAPAEIRAELLAGQTTTGPHSAACRSSDCRDCRWSWCEHGCHQRARLALVRDEPAIGQRSPEPVDAGRWADEARRLLAAKS